MIYVILLFFIIILDHVTKIYVAGQGPSLHVTVIDKVLNIVYKQNTGAAFSSGANTTWAQPLFITLTVIILPVLFVVFLKLGNNRKWLKTAIIFVIGGTIGNFIERIVFGAVTDFIDMHFYVCNIADVALTVGAVMLVIWFLFLDKEALIPIKKISGKKKNG